MPFFSIMFLYTVLGQLLFLLPACPDHPRDVREEQSSSKYQPCPQPMVGGEGVVKVQDREEEAEKLPECDHKGDSETGTLCGQDKDRGYTEVLSEDIANEVEEHGGDVDI